MCTATCAHAHTHTFAHKHTPGIDAFADGRDKGSQQRLTPDGQQAIVSAEAKSEHFLVAAWRPITMLTFLALAVGDSLGFLATPLRDEAWALLQLGLGGYVVGRSGEKIAKVMKG